MRWAMGVVAVITVGVSMACGSTPAGAPSQAMYDQFDRDWQYWMAQYPETVAILLPGGVTSEGRTAVRALFEGFCLPYPAGLKGLQFSEVKSWTVGKTVNVQWVANAPFLAVPYYGADAYVTKNGLMGAQVTTFDGAELQFIP